MGMIPEIPVHADRPETDEFGVEELRVAAVVQRSARAILVDDRGRLVLIKRTRPGEAPYWTAPGGGVDETDPSPSAALARELGEELGATAVGYEQVFLFSSPSGDGVAVQHFFVCRLTDLDPAARTGEEFQDPARGGYDVDFVDLVSGALVDVDLKPAALKEFILANRDALLDAAAVPVAG